MSAGNESDGSAGGCRAVHCEEKTPEKAEGGGAFFSSDAISLYRSARKLQPAAVHLKWAGQKKNLATYDP